MLCTRWEGGPTKPAEAAQTHENFGDQHDTTTTTTISFIIEAKTHATLLEYASALPALSHITPVPAQPSAAPQRAFSLAEYKEWYEKRSLAQRMFDQDEDRLGFMARHKVPWRPGDGEAQLKKHIEYRLQHDRRERGLRIGQRVGHDTIRPYAKTAKRVNRFMGLPDWRWLDEYKEAKTKREPPTEATVALLLAPETKLSHYRYTNAVRKHALAFMFGSGVRPPSEVVLLELEDVRWDLPTGRSISLLDFYEAAVREDAAALERLYAAIENVGGTAYVRQHKKKEAGEPDILARPLPAHVLSARNSLSLVNYVVHWRASLARKGRTIATKCIFVSWRGGDYICNPKEPGKKFGAELNRVCKIVWPPYRNYCARGFYARKRIAEGATVEEVADELGDTIATIQRYYIGKAGQRNTLPDRAASARASRRIRRVVVA